MEWVQSADLTWLYLDDRSRLLGRLKPVSDDPRVKWEASVIHGGYLRAHGSYFDEGVAKSAVEDFERGTPSHRLTQPHNKLPDDANDVMREQLEFLIEHAQAGDCGCRQCERYQQLQGLLLEAFTEHAREG